MDEGEVIEDRPFQNVIGSTSVAASLHVIIRLSPDDMLDVPQSIGKTRSIPKNCPIAMTMSMSRKPASGTVLLSSCNEADESGRWLVR